MTWKMSSLRQIHHLLRGNFPFPPPLHLHHGIIALISWYMKATLTQVHYFVSCFSASLAVNLIMSNFSIESKSSPARIFHKNEKTHGKSAKNDLVILFLIVICLFDSEKLKYFQTKFRVLHKNV